jgi:hypothetical protein
MFGEVMKHLLYILGAGLLFMFPCQSRAEGLLHALSRASAVVEPSEPGDPGNSGDAECTKEKLDQACLILQGCYSVYFDTDMDGQQIVDKCLETVACQMVEKYKPCTEDIKVYSFKTTSRPRKFLRLVCGNESNRYPVKGPYTAKVTLPSVKQCQDEGLVE